MKNVPINELKRVQGWAKEKIQGGSEPPWAWYQYMKLIETVDAIFDGLAGTTTMENSQQSNRSQERPLQLVASKSPPGNARHRHGKMKIRMPM